MEKTRRKTGREIQEAKEKLQEAEMKKALADKKRGSFITFPNMHISLDHLLPLAFSHSPSLSLTFSLSPSLSLSPALSLTLSLAF